MEIKLFAIFSCALLGLAYGETIQLKLSARDLPNFDVFDGPPDPYAVVWYSEKLGDPYTKVGETKFFQDRHDVTWPEVFSFDYQSVGSEQRIKIDIMDDDVDEDDYMGLVEFYLNEVAASFGNIVEKDLIGTKEGGIITITGDFPKYSPSTNWVETRIKEIDRKKNIKTNKFLRQ